jgi:hypothetical protein
MKGFHSSCRVKRGMILILVMGEFIQDSPLPNYEADMADSILGRL